MKRVKHFLLASCLFPALLGAQEMANANFLKNSLNKNTKVLMNRLRS